MTGDFANSARPTSVRWRIASASASALLIFLSVTGASVQFWSTLRLLNRLNPWKTMPIFSRSLLTSTCSAARSWPWNHTWPESGVSSRLMQRRSVDLPEPDAPMMVTTSPGMTSKSMFLRTTWSPKLLRRPSILMTGSVPAVLLAAMAYMPPLCWVCPDSISVLMVWLALPATPVVTLTSDDDSAGPMAGASRRTASVERSFEAIMVRMR